MNIFILSGPPEEIRAAAAYATRSREGISNLKNKFKIEINSLEKISNEISNLTANVIKSLDRYNHFSTREAVDLHLSIEGCSRVFSFWFMTLSKYGSFLQQSQRHTQPKDVIDGFSDMGFIQKKYDELIDAGIREEDARYLLSQATTTNFYTHLNLREVENIIAEVGKYKYPEEIYNGLDQILKAFETVAPKSSEFVREKFNSIDPVSEYLQPKLSQKSEYVPKAEITYLSAPTGSALERVYKQSVVNMEFKLSVAATHQLIRHRKIEKIITEMGFGFITPPEIKRGDFYFEYLEGIYKLFEIAEKSGGNWQYYLPNAALVRLIGSEDIYTFLENFIGLRTCRAAQWEIRKAAFDLRAMLQNKLNEEIPIGRCRYLTQNSRLSELFPPQPCPEDKKIKELCGIYQKLRTQQPPR